MPPGVDGVKWYWARHTVADCSLELPNLPCPSCGLLRSEHTHGHRPANPAPASTGGDDAAEMAEAHDDEAEALVIGWCESAEVAITFSSGEALAAAIRAALAAAEERALERVLAKVEEHIAALKANGENPACSPAIWSATGIREAVRALSARGQGGES